MYVGGKMYENRIRTGRFFFFFEIPTLFILRKSKSRAGEFNIFILNFSVPFYAKFFYLYD